MVTLDVVGLYPHVPEKEGLETMKIYLDKREDQSVSSDSLYKLVKIILKHHYFELGQDVYHKIFGTAIGLKFALNDANIFMAGLEQGIFSNTEFQPLLWLHYMDNIFCLRTDFIEKLKEFLEFLNAFHPFIIFAMDYPPYQINYSDVLMNQMNQGKPCVQVYIRNPLIPTSIYTHDLVTMSRIKSQYPIAKLFQ